MDTQFPGLPEGINTYQNRFDYAVWTPNTNIQCCCVPWDSSYRDIISFPDRTTKDAYFDKASQAGQSFRLGTMVYLRYNEAIRVNLPFDVVSKCNYLIVTNSVQPVPPSDRERTPDTFYYFMNDVRYIAPNTTEIVVQLDVWQTYSERFTFDQCYCERGHIGIANQNSTISNLSAYLTEPEGLNIGDEYGVVHQHFINFLDEQPYILIMSTTNLAVEWGTVSAPLLNTATGGVYDDIPGGANCYAISGEMFVKFMRVISDAPWVSQGISYITIVPRLLLGKLVNPIIVKGCELYELSGRDTLEENIYIVNDFFKNFKISPRYKNLLKFYCSPYASIEISTLSGGEIVGKPECFRQYFSAESDMVQLKVEGCVSPPSVSLVAYPVGYNDEVSGDGYIRNFVVYNVNGEQELSTITPGENFDFAVRMTNFPQLSLVNNQYINTLASTNYSRNYAFNSAEWSQQKAMMGASTSQQQATSGMDAAKSRNTIANTAATVASNISQEQNLWGGVQNVASGVGNTIGSVASRDAGGALAGVASVGMAAINTGLNMDWISRSTANQIDAARDTTGVNIKNSAFIRDTNYAYATTAAQGDYAMAIQGIQAKVQDMRLTQPSTSGQNGGDLFNFSKGYVGILIKWKRIKENYVRQIGEYWLRYGYYVNRWVTPPANLLVMTKFTYWKMSSTALRTSFVPEVFKEAMRGIMEKGVTVWANPDEMYRIDFADNEPLEGIGYY